MKTPTMTEKQFCDLVKRALDSIRANDPTGQDVQTAFDALYILLKRELRGKGVTIAKTPQAAARHKRLEKIVDELLAEVREW